MYDTKIFSLSMFMFALNESGKARVESMQMDITTNFWSFYDIR